MLVQLVGADCLDEVLDSAFDFVVLAAELLRLNGNPIFLHLDECIKSVSLGILGQVNEHSLGEGLEVVLNTVFHDVIDIDNELLKLGKTLVNVVKVTIDVHRGPGESTHTGAELVLKIFKVRHKERLGVGSDLVDDAVVLTENELELVVVVLELFFLEEHNLGRFGNINSNSREALSFSDKSEDFRIEVDVELHVVGVTNDKSGLETGLCLLDLKGPFLPPEVLVREQGVTDSVVLLDGLLVEWRLWVLWGELLHGN